MSDGQAILSIVIANYNYGRFLEEAILSILRQCGCPILGESGAPQLPLSSGDRLELIVVDGGSQDNSVEIIRKYASSLTWWVSERDRGQSDAFNKGFGHSTGRFLTWLNADDLMVDGALEKVVEQIRKHPTCEWFTSNGFRFLPGGKVLEANWGPHFLPGFLQQRNAPVVAFGPSAFFSRRIYENVGKIDETLHFVMDTDLWLKFMHAGIRQRRINCFTWAFRMHEDSKTAEFGNHMLDEKCAKKLRDESTLIKERLGYRMSPGLHMAVRLWRLMDGSLLCRMYYRLFFRQFQSSRIGDLGS